jgi:outer membrane lipoprotein carrier protein
MTMRRTMQLAVAGLVALGASAAAAPPPQTDLLDRAVAAWAKVKTARATFEQTIVNPLTGTTLTSTGEYQQQRPGKLSVKFDNPATDRIVADGQYVWLYLPSSVPDQVIRSPLSSAGTGTVDLTAQFLTAPRKRYIVTSAGTLTVSGRPTHGYTLVPKTTGAPFKTATVYVDDADATIRQFVVTEPNGVQRTVRLTSFRPNAPVDAKAFVFVVPPGMRVVAH